MFTLVNSVGKYIIYDFRVHKTEQLVLSDKDVGF